MNLYIHFNTQTIPSVFSKLTFFNKEELISVGIVSDFNSLPTIQYDKNNQVIYEGMTVRGLNKFNGESKVVLTENGLLPFYYLSNYDKDNFIITSFVKQYEQFYISNEFNIKYAFENNKELMLSVFNHLKLRGEEEFTDVFSIDSLTYLIKKYGFEIKEYKFGIESKIINVLSTYYDKLSPEIQIDIDYYGKIENIENQINIYTNNVTMFDKFGFRNNINFTINSVNYFNPQVNSLLSIDVAREYKQIYNETK